MEVQCNLTKEDYVQYYFYANYKKGKLAIFDIVLILIVSVLFLLFVNLKGFDFTKSFIGIIIAALFFLLLFRISITLALTNNGSIITKHFISIDQQGLTEKFSNKTIITEWAGVRDVVDNKCSIYFLFDNGDACIVPKRSFINPEAALKFLRLATANWTRVE